MVADTGTSRQIAELKQRIQVLEEKLNADSRNSSRPPSTDPKKRQAGQSRALLPPEQVTHTHDCHPPPTCRCGGVVRISHMAWRHQVNDLLLVTARVTEYRLYGRRT